EILGFVDLMKESALDPEQRKHIRGIGYIANNLSGILDQLQEYVQLATEKEELEEIDFNFFGIIKDTLFLCNALIVHKEVKLSIDIDREVPTFLIGDPSKLSQILLYLLGNTIKYITEGDIHLRIGVKEDLGNACSLQFKINHPGVGKAPIGLEQFYSCLARPGASNREIFSDAGLEMDIIKQLVKNLRGAIPAALTQEMDTSFSFNLPYAKGTGIKRDNKNMPIHKKNHLEKIWQECSGEVDLLEELIGLFKGSVLEFIGKLKIYLPLGEYEKIGSAARKVRASACLMRADSLLPIIDALLINCRTERDIHYFNRLYDQFLATYPPLEAAIDAELHLLKLKAKGKR
ncbi:MAG TPA: ATP-binding protein, partial [Arenibacter sp.]|nr:ATP-binding protein [Arenibacter sp.]